MHITKKEAYNLVSEMALVMLKNGGATDYKSAAKMNTILEHLETEWKDKEEPLTPADNAG